MRIIFSGTQGSGKTTLVNELKNIKFFEEYAFAQEIVRDLMREGLKINEDGDDVLQLSVYTKHAANLMKTRNLVSDRGFVDAVAYSRVTKSNGKVSDLTVRIGKELLEASIKWTDIFFYIPPEVPLKDDGVRSMDEDFRGKVHQAFLEVYEETGIKPCILTGTVEERLSQIIQEINRKMDSLLKERK
jgi:nicotinamide riboside kinase